MLNPRSMFSHGSFLSCLAPTNNFLLDSIHQENIGSQYKTSQSNTNFLFKVQYLEEEMPAYDRERKREISFLKVRQINFLGKPFTERTRSGESRPLQRKLKSVTCFEPLARMPNFRIKRSKLWNFFFRSDCLFSGNLRKREDFSESPIFQSQQVACSLQFMDVSAHPRCAFLTCLSMSAHASRCTRHPRQRHWQMTRT